MAVMPLSKRVLTDALKATKDQRTNLRKLRARPAATPAQKAEYDKKLARLTAEVEDLELGLTVLNGGAL